MSSQNTKLVFYGGVGSTTGANILLEANNTKILVDCGFLQGFLEIEKKNFDDFAYNPSSIDFLLITHAHMDHIGKVPKLVKDGFKGKIISTLETKELALPMLIDACKVIKSKHKKSLFDEIDINNSLSLWQGYEYGEAIKLTDGIELKMIDAGHILGSSILVVSVKEGKETKNFAFTGDLGNSPSPLLKNTEIPQNIDYLIMESVYGDRNHQNKEERRDLLKQYITEGITKNGTVIIPAFSIERTQVLLYEINNMVENGEIKSVPVFLDSPLAEKITSIYKKYTKNFNALIEKEIKEGDDIFDFPNLHIIKDSFESKGIERMSGAKIILAGSGMSEGGRVVNHEIAHLSDQNATIILVGYQAVGSFGRTIESGTKEVEVWKDGKKQKLKVKATIKSISGYSSHKDSDHLLEFVELINNPSTKKEIFENGEGNRSTKLKTVFVMMGEPKSSLFLSQRIREYLDIKAICPEENKEYEL